MDDNEIENIRIKDIFENGIDELSLSQKNIGDHISGILWEQNDEMHSAYVIGYKGIIDKKIVARKTVSRAGNITIDYIPIENGKINGRRRFYYYSGKPMASGEYSNGKLHGIYIKYWAGGKSAVESIVLYEYGKIHGQSIYYDVGGKIYARYYSINDVRVSDAEFRSYELIKRLAGLNG